MAKNKTKQNEKRRRRNKNTTLPVLTDTVGYATFVKVISSSKLEQSYCYCYSENEYYCSIWI